MTRLRPVLRPALLLVALICALALTALAVAAGAVPGAPPVFGPNVRANSDATGNGQHEPSLAVSRTHTEHGRSRH